MPRELREYKVSLDSAEVEALMKNWDTDSASQLLQSLVDSAFEHYVVEGDGLMSVKAHRKETEEQQQKIEKLGRAVADYRKKLELREETDREKRLCPNCSTRVKFDALNERFICPECGWSGDYTLTILEE